MRFALRLIGALAFLLTCSTANLAQDHPHAIPHWGTPLQVENVPFTAVLRLTMRDHEGRVTPVETTRVARAGNGNSSVEPLEARGAPRFRDIVLAVANSPTTAPGTVRYKIITLYPDHTYEVAFTAPGDLQSFEWCQTKLRDYLTTDSWPNNSWHLVPLGTKEQDGMRLYGQQTLMLAGSKRFEREQWFSLDLCARILHIQYPEDPADAKEATTYTATLTDIKRGEPDPKLFEIPDGYEQRPSKP